METVIFKSLNGYIHSAADAERAKKAVDAWEGCILTPTWEVVLDEVAKTAEKNKIKTSEWFKKAFKRKK